jgi:CO dehydrogenase/acetyl-CoA synthase beta subunit
MTEITVPDEITDRIARRIDHTEFDSVDEYAEFVLSEVLTRVERDADGSQEDDPGASREEVQARLQSLGYLEE